MLSSVVLSLRDSLCLLAVMISLAIAEESISLKITDFSPSQVDLSCSLESDRNITEVNINVDIGPKRCLDYANQRCETMLTKDCDITCKNSEDNNNKALLFFVKLDGTCHQKQMSIKCAIFSHGEKLSLEKALTLTAQSYPPLISVNNGKPVEASCMAVPIACTVKDTCSQKSKLVIWGDGYQENEEITLSHKQQENRFTSTAITTAIFKEAKNYTIWCKEEGKHNRYSRNFTLEVHPSTNVTCLQNEEEDVHFSLSTAGLIPTMIIFTASVFFNLITMVFCISRCMKKSPKKPQRSQWNGDVEGYPLLASESSTPCDSSICGFWVPEDKKYGEKICNFINSGSNCLEVHKEDMDDISFLQRGRGYIGYYAVISAQSLKNHNFVTQITTVLRLLTLCHVHSQSNFVLVVVSDETNMLLDQLKTRRPINLQTIPLVKAIPQLNDDHLKNIVSLLEGPPVNREIPLSSGSIGIGLAWTSFYNKYVYTFSGMKTRIEQSKAVKKYPETMSRYYIVVIPESTEVSNNLLGGLSSFTDMGQLDEGIQIEPAWQQPTLSTERFYKVTNSKGEEYYCCQGHVTLSSSLKKMISSGELKAEESEKQFCLFMETMGSILQHPHCADGVLIYNCSDVSKLADNLCQLIEVPPEPVIRHIDPLNQVTAVAEGLARSYYHRRLIKIGPRVGKWIESSRYYKRNLLPKTVFIMLPYSCHCYSKLSDAKDEHVEFTMMLRPDERRHPVSMYKISTDMETYYACAEYCSEVQVLLDMVTKWQLGFTDMHKAAELRVLHEMLSHLLTRPTAPDYCAIFRLVYYNDYETSGKKLSEVLVEEIKQCLREEN